MCHLSVQTYARHVQENPFNRRRDANVSAPVSFSRRYRPQNTTPRLDQTGLEGRHANQFEVNVAVDVAEQPATIPDKGRDGRDYDILYQSTSEERLNNLASVDVGARPSFLMQRPHQVGWVKAHQAKA